jgi:glycosyltransferase involved in cell wall biosynthesis
MGAEPAPERPFYAIGPEPPPVNGMALAFQAMVRHFVIERFDLQVLNVASSAPHRSMLSIAERCFKYAKVLARIGSGRTASGAYICLSGQLGLLFDWLVLCVLRARGVPIFLHHHSFAYLTRRRRLAAAVFRMAGEEATHIALGPAMATALQAHYGIAPSEVIIVSNAGLMRREGQARPMRPLQTIGFLSNLIPGKGLETVLALARAVHDAELPWRVVVAGPCEDSVLLPQLLAARADGKVTWLGPVHGAAKAEFFAEIDVFLFPTSYVNEAEPLVIWEALMNGIPVIAYDRGCIAGQVRNAGLVLPPQANFVAGAMKTLQSWASTPESFASLVAAASARFAKEQADAAKALTRLVALARVAARVQAMTAPALARRKLTQ